MSKLMALYKRCKKSDTSFTIVMIRFLYHKVIHHKKLLLHQRVKIKGVRNIESTDKLEIGIDYIGFSHRTDKTYLNIRGKLKISGECYIRRGCRLDIGGDANVSFGDGVFINANTKLIIMNSLSIGNGSVISWDCQLLDIDFHKISYIGRKDVDHSIMIGDHVWIGCGTKIYKGSVIPDGCVVASDSVVKRAFSVKNALIGGNPARVLRENVEWSKTFEQ